MEASTYLRERSRSTLLKTKSHHQREEDGDDASNNPVPLEGEMNKPRILSVSMFFNHEKGNKTDNLSNIFSHSKIMKQKESIPMLQQDSNVLEDPRSLLMLLYQRDLEIKGLKNAAQKDPADRLSHILEELVKRRQKGLLKRRPHEVALQKEIDKLNNELKAVKEDHVKEIQFLEEEVAKLKTYSWDLQQKKKTLKAKPDGETDIASSISLDEGAKPVQDCFEQWTESGQLITTETSDLRLRRIPKHTSFVDTIHKFGSISVTGEEKEITRLNSIVEEAKPRTYGSSEESSQESLKIGSKLASEQSLQVLLSCTKSDITSSENKLTETSSSSLPSLEEKVLGKKSFNLVHAQEPSKLTPIVPSLGQLSDVGQCPHFVHIPFLKECKSCHTNTSSLRIVSVHRKGKFVRIFNSLLNKEIDLSGYIIQQWIGGYPVSIYRFPKGIILPAQHHITVWAAGANLAHEPSSLSATHRFFKAGPDCITILSNYNGQMVSQYTNPHQFTAAVTAYSDNVDLSIDKFPLCDDEEADESWNSKISFYSKGSKYVDPSFFAKGRNSESFPIDSSPAYKMRCSRTVENKGKVNEKCNSNSGSFLFSSKSRPSCSVKENSSHKEEDNFASQSLKPVLEKPVTRTFKTTLDTTIPMVSLLGLNNARSKYSFNYMTYLPITTDLHLRRYCSTR